MVLPKVLKIGDAILGHWTTPEGFRRPLTWRQVMAWQRLNELARLSHYRAKHGLDAGPAIGWANVLANLSACLGEEVGNSSVEDLCRRMSLNKIDPDIVAGVTRDVEKARRVWSTYELLGAASTGALIHLTALERADLRIQRIDAWEEPAADRKRRLARERQRRKRQRC
ncbi:hypothetical protein NKH24_06815 [Mesorhizobium sp. M1300]|uniref:hypothetical protein n=1 Tax=Mesorhizobium sp. M1300 TaxID=2957077 RepID=UPI00333AD2AB